MGLGNFLEEFVSDPISQLSRGARSGLKAEVPEFPDIDMEGLIETQARVNRVNQVSPFGTTEFSTDPETGEVTRTTDLSDPLQSQFDRLTGEGGGFGEDTRQTIEDALFERQRRLLDPVFDQQEDRLRTGLSARGIPTNTEGASGEFGELTRFERGRNTAFENASLNSVLASSGEQRASRGQDFGEFLSLLSGTNQQGVNPIDVTGPAGLAQGNELAGLQAQMAASAANKQGATQIGSTAAMLAFA